MVLEFITLTKLYCFISIFRSYFIFSPTYLFLCFHLTTTGSMLGLPDWLQNLLTCCCFLKDFKTQTMAISTVLELITLTKSVMSSSDNKLVLPNPPNSPRFESGTISVVLIPAISSKHLECLNYSSSYFQVGKAFLFFSGEIKYIRTV